MEEKSKSKLVLWVKRLGVGGFLFFLIKGLIWLAVFYFGGKAIMSTGDEQPSTSEQVDSLEHQPAVE